MVWYGKISRRDKFFQKPRKHGRMIGSATMEDSKQKKNAKTECRIRENENSKEFGSAKRKNGASEISKRKIQIGVSDRQSFMTACAVGSTKIQNWTEVVFLNRNAKLECRIRKNERGTEGVQNLMNAKSFTNTFFHLVKSNQTVVSK